MHSLAHVEIAKQGRRAFIYVTVGEKALHKIYNGMGEAAAEAERLGLVDRYFARTMPKYGISFRGTIRDLDLERLVKVGFEPINPD
jgi:hypothetical protein